MSAVIQSTVIHRFQSMARAYPENEALCIAGTVVSYAALAARGESIRRAIAATGSADDECIGVLTGDDLDTYASILAILANGSAYVPINSKNPPARVRGLVEQAGLNLVLTSRPHPPLEGAARETMLVSEIETAAGDLEIIVRPERDLAYLFFTSGSTGQPKGVPIHHRNLNAFIDVMLDEAYYDFKASDRFLQMFELTFDLSVMSFFTPLCVGACCHIVPEKGISYMNVITALREQEVTVALMVPSILTYLKRFFDEIELPGLRYSLFCGEALSQSMAEAWSACVPNATIQNVYGPTEATIFGLIYPWRKSRAAEEAANGVVAIGTPMPGMRALVIDENGAPLPAGEKGELCLYGDQVTDRYWRDPEKTAAAFGDIEGVEGKAYRTGDLALVNARGNFVYLGRFDFQVKIDGHRIELGEIEHFAREFARGSTREAVVATVAIALTDDEGRTTLKLFIESADVSIDELRAYLKTRLPPYMQPREVERVERLPLNANGKIDRGALVEMSSPC